MEEPYVKGQTMKSFLLYMQKTLSPEQVVATLAAVAPDRRNEIERGILATSTFPMAMLNRLTTEAARVSGIPLADFARGAGRFAAQEGVRGVYRIFVRVLTPEALLSKAASMWSSMNTRGKMESIPEGGSSTTCRLSDYPSDPVMCMRIIGWIEQLAEMTGAKPIVVHGLCVAKGDGVCEWRVRW